MVPLAAPPPRGPISRAVYTDQVAMKLSLGSKKLAQERAALVNQFNSGHSLFAKAERKELKELSGRSSPRQLLAPASLKDSWHL